jgi:adenosylcobinamide-GDP ribazoletransferase
VLLSAALPYARAGDGLGRALGGGGRVRAVVAVAVAAGLCVWLDAAWLLVPVAVVIVVAAVTARRWLGGVTGDVLGATAELSELAALVVAVALA